MDWTAAALDYTKCFDRLDPDSVFNMLRHMGYPEGVIAIQRALYCDMKQHRKIAGSYGEVMTPLCGLAQGCSSTSITVNATVTRELNMLDDITTGIDKAAFIDDRSLDTKTLDELEKGIEAVVDMDAKNGTRYKHR